MSVLRSQLELHANEAVLGKPWKQLARREAKAEAAATAAGETYVPPGQRLETTFLPDMLVEFLQVCSYGLKPMPCMGTSVLSQLQ